MSIEHAVNCSKYYHAGKHHGTKPPPDRLLAKEIYHDGLLPGNTIENSVFVVAMCCKCHHLFGWPKSRIGEKATCSVCVKTMDKPSRRQRQLRTVRNPRSQGGAYLR